MAAGYDRLHQLLFCPFFSLGSYDTDLPTAGDCSPWLGVLHFELQASIPAVQEFFSLLIPFTYQMTKILRGKENAVRDQHEFQLFCCCAIIFSKCWTWKLV